MTRWNVAASPSSCANYGADNSTELYLADYITMTCVQLFVRPSACSKVWAESPAQSSRLARYCSGKCSDVGSVLSPAQTLPFCPDVSFALLALDS